TFAHDFLGRLAHWIIAQDSKITDWQFDYDDLGNLRSRETNVPLHLSTVTYETYPASQFSYTLPEHLMHPHAVKSVTTSGLTVGYEYDAAGRMISGAGNT